MINFNRPNIEKFRHLNHVVGHRYERYLPTAFDESLSLLEKVNKMIEFLNAVTDHINHQSDTLEKWQEELVKSLGVTFDEYADFLEEVKKQYEDFRESIENDLLPESVTNKLEEWFDSGKLEELINDSIFSDIQERVEILENRIQSVKLSVKDFGAVGDGVHDDTRAFREASSRGETVSIPEGRYIVTGQIELLENTQFIGEGENSVIVNQNKGGVLFRATGNQIREDSFTQSSKIGDHFVTVSNTDNYETGDYIRAMSQRVATSVEDAGYEHALGHTTSDSHKVYFGEVRRISAKNDTQLFFRGGLIYPDYLTHSDDETHEHARRNSTVQKLNLIDGIRLQDFKVDGPFTTVAMLEMCVNAKVENVVWENAEDGDFVNFRESYMSEAKNCKVYYRADVPAGGLYSRNGFKIQSSESCGFLDCEMHHGTQNVDFTYNGWRDTIPANHCYFKRGKIVGAINHCLTTHGGTFAPIISDNIFINNTVDGILVRSREAVITNNVVSGTPREDTPLTHGITLNQYASQNALITGNKVSGFLYGIAFRDSLNLPHRHIGAVITDNYFTRINTGIWFRRATRDRVTERANVIIANNVFTDFIHQYGKGVRFNNHYRGVKILNNIFRANNDSINGGIYSTRDVHDIEIKGNVFQGRIEYNPVDMGDITDWFGTRFSIDFDNSNKWSGRHSDISLGDGLTLQRNTFYQHLYPHEDEGVNLGWSDYRFNRMFSSGGVTTTSDRRYKEDLRSEKLGLDFVNKLTPLTFAMKSNGERHHGLIAQDVEKVLKEMGLPKDSFYGLLHETEGSDGNEIDVYSINYAELIPILIQAIQELQNKNEG